MSLTKFVQTITVPAPALPIKFILDNDLGGDCDDAGDHALAHKLYTEGLCEIVGEINVKNVETAVAANDVVNTYYGRPAIPIGANKLYGGISTGDDYATYWSNNFTHDLVYADAPEGVTLYRQLLAAQTEKIKILITGPARMFYQLLLSEADVYSPLSGSALVSAKVSEVVFVVGRYPLALAVEANVNSDKVSASYIVANCPVPLTICGCEIGDLVRTGSGLTANTPETNPVRYAYEAVVGANTAQGAWAQVGTLYMCLGTSTYFLVTNGTAIINVTTGISTFTYSPSGPHKLLMLKHAQITNIQNLIDGYLNAAP